MFFLSFFYKEKEKEIKLSKWIRFQHCYYKCLDDPLPFIIIEHQFKVSYCWSIVFNASDSGCTHGVYIGFPFWTRQSSDILFVMCF